MGRNRKKANQKLPDYVYINRGRYVYIQRINGVQQKPVVMGKVSDTPLHELYSAYNDLTAPNNTDTVQYLADQYLASDKFKALKSGTETKRNLKTILAAPCNGKTLGDANYRDVTTGLIQQYIDWRAMVAANREIAALSSAWSWCYRRDITLTPNPVKGVERFKESHRTRLVSEAEYMAVYALASKPYKVAMELAYLCRMRRSEVLDTRYKDVTDDGLDTRRLKGSKDAITLWSDRLRAAVDMGMAGKIKTSEMPLVTTDKGTQIRGNAFSKQFKILVDKSGVEPFTFHDLKRRGVTNFDGDKKDAGGWQSEAMVRTYDMSKLKAKATE